LVDSRAPGSMVDDRDQLVVVGEVPVVVATPLQLVADGERLGPGRRARSVLAVPPVLTCCTTLPGEPGHQIDPVGGVVDGRGRGTGQRCGEHHDRTEDSETRQGSSPRPAIGKQLEHSDLRF